MTFLRYKRQSLTIFLVTFFTTVIVGCTHHSPLNKALNFAGDNRSELEAVFDHYKDDPEKLKTHACLYSCAI